MDGFETDGARSHRGLTYPFGRRVPDAADGDSFEIADGLYWARMPLPFALKFINVWLAHDGGRWSVIDTGVTVPEAKANWRALFAGRMDGAPVHRILVTHMHPDHVGNAGWIARKHPGARLWMSRLEYTTCRMLVADTGRGAPDEGIAFYRRAGWDDAQIQHYKERFGGFGRGVAPMPDAYRRLQDGDTFDMGGGTWRVIVGSGHSPEHVCLFDAERNLLISGDQILPRISSNVSVFPTEPDANPLKDWLDSCARLKAAVPEDVLVLPAHNEPFRGAHTRLQGLIEGHERSLERLHAHLAEPRRVTEVFRVLFARPIDLDVIGMATGEARAHLNCLIARGQALCEPGDDGVDRYRAC